MPSMKYRIKQRKPLTPEEQDALIADYNAGLPLKDIEIKFNISRGTIYNTLHGKDQE